MQPLAPGLARARQPLLVVVLGLLAVFALGGSAAGSARGVASKHLAAVASAGPGQSGVVAAYSFDANGGATVADDTGHGHKGTISGARWSGSGKSGGSLSFDGRNDLVTIADASALDLSTGMTLEAWVYPTSLGRSWRTVLLKEKPNGMVYSLYANDGDGDPIGQVNIGGEKNAVGGSLQRSAWTHLATTFDGSTLRLYKNGVLVASRNAAGAIPASTGSLRIGGNSIWREWFEGRLDDVRVYDRALSAVEIQTDMSTPVGTGPPADTQAPSSPSGLRTSGQSQSAITLAWNASTDNVGVVGYGRYRNNTILSSEPGTSHTFNGLACGTTYTLAVDAYDAAGNRSGRASVTAATTACSTADTTAPSQPGNLGASGQTQTAITLNWTAASDNVGVAGYGYYRGGALIGNGTGTSYTFTGLTCGTSYTLGVDAYDAAGNRSARPAITASTSTCPAPPPAGAGPVAAYSFDAGSGSGLADASGNGNNGTISGAAWTGGRFGGALSFDGSNDWVTVADSNSLDLTTGMTLQAWVRPSTLGAWPTVVTKETSGNLVYGLFANSDVNQPAAITTIGGSPLQSITRGPSALPVATWTHVATTYDGATLRMYVNGAQVASDTVTGAMAKTTGVLRIGGNSVWPEWFAGQIDELRIYNRALSVAELQADMATPVGGGSGADTEAPSAPSSLSASGQAQTAITLSWSPASDNVGVTGYGYYRGGSLAGNGSATSYTFTGLTCNTSYTLAVDAYDAAGNRSTRPSINASTSACTTVDTTPPSAPGNLAASGQTQTAITLSWSPASDNVGVTGYGYYRGTTLAGSGTGTSYTFTGLACGTSYTLAADAYDAAGNRSSRPSLSATTSACTPPPPPPGNGTANLWVDTSGGSCVRQSTRGGWVDAQGCSWTAAYQAAQTGDLILVKGGSYGNVNIGPNKSSIGAPGVTFQTNAGESVTVGNLENGHIAGGTGGSNINFVGPVTSRTFRSDRADNVVVDGWNVDCGGCVNVQTFHIEAATNVTVKNSEISDNTDNSLIWISGSNLTFENNRIHDAGLRAGSGAHTECMYAWSVTNLTLKRNHFYHCSVMDVFITGSSVANGGYVENNIFEKPWSTTGNIGNGLAFHFRNGGSPPTPDPNNWDFRYNTFVGPLSITTDANPVGSGGMRLIGNIFLASSPSCGHSNTSWSYNAFTGGGCGSNSITNSLSAYQAGFNSTGDPGDYSLKSGSVLRDKGSASSYPATDRTGGARYTGSAPDIGAYEFRG